MATIVAQPIAVVRATLEACAREVSEVEFALICPNDGRVDLTIEDVSAVVFRDPESVEVVFTCPHCGASLRASLRVPNMLAAAIELARYAEQLDEDRPAGGIASGHPVDADLAADIRDQGEQRERAGEAYCEYFRRQLARVECVEDLLQEMDGSSS